MTTSPYCLDCQQFVELDVHLNCAGCHGGHLVPAADMAIAHETLVRETPLLMAIGIECHGDRELRGPKEVTLGGACLTPEELELQQRYNALEQMQLETHRVPLEVDGTIRAVLLFFVLVATRAAAGIAIVAREVWLTISGRP